MTLIIPILAAGYLLTIYVLLVLAERNAKESSSQLMSGSETLHKQEAPVTGKISEASSSVR